MFENLELINQHHLSDLKKEAQHEFLVNETLKGKNKSKRARQIGLLSMLANLVHIR